MTARLSNWWRLILNRCTADGRSRWVQPCLLCAAPSRGNRLCEACASCLPRLGPSVCGTCAAPLATGDECGACLKHPPRFDAVRAALIYAFPVDALIQAYKYGGDLSVARTLARMILEVATESVDVIVPMPLARERLRERGFNQAYELARLLGGWRGIPVEMNACRKVRHTAAQASLPWKERSRNVRGSFVCDADMSGRRVAIVDDVMTTGATLNELAKNIKRAGAVRVVGWVAARALRHRADAASILPGQSAPGIATAIDAAADRRMPATPN